jgi:hypothetical protein
MSFTPEKIFDRIAENLGTSRCIGGGPRIDELRHVAGEYCDAWRGWPNAINCSPKIYSGITNASRLNAFAIHRDGIDVIGINKGVDELVRSLFHLLFRCPEVFPAVGVCSTSMVESPWETLHRLPSDTCQIGGDLIDAPDDVARRCLANLLAKYALEFLIAHELAHVIRGHVRLTVNDRLIQIEERGYEDAHPRQDDCLLRHALEMDADAFATVQGIKNVSNRTIRSDSELELLCDRVTALNYWLFSTHCLFRLFEPTKVELDRLCTTSHPPARIRQSWVNESCIALCDDGRIEIEPATFWNISNETTLNVDDSITRIAPNAGPLDEASITAERAVDEHMDRIREKWCEIRPELMKVAYVTDLTPCSRDSILL